MTDPDYDDVKHTSSTRSAYDRLAPVWSATTDDGPFNGGLERPALRTLIPRPLTGSTVLDAGCGSGGRGGRLRRGDRVRAGTAVNR